MKTYPIQTISLDEAQEMQFKLVNCIHQIIPGSEMLSQGDLGVNMSCGAPIMTRKVEEVLASFFETEAAILVRGSGTGALRNVINVSVKPLEEIIIHDAPIYPTTDVIIKSMGLRPLKIDFNKEDANWNQAKNVSFAIVQHSRQKIDDSYNLENVIKKLKQINPNIKILVDDNYTTMKTLKIGAQLGADASGFSMFKLLGPEGIGCVVGSLELIRKIRGINYSGGSQVQGHEALDSLRALVYTPVSFAIQAKQVTEIYERLKQGEVEGIKKVFIANAQSRVVIVELKKPIAKAVLKTCEILGGAPHPIGSESKYEIVTLFYRVSGTFRKVIPHAEETMIRINPMRAGADTVIRILKSAIEQQK